MNEKEAREFIEKLVAEWMVNSYVAPFYREKAARELVRLVSHTTTNAADAEYVAPCGCHGEVMCDRHDEWFNPSLHR